MKRRILPLLVAVMAIALSTNAQAPDQLNYQAVVRNA